MNGSELEDREQTAAGQHEKIDGGLSAAEIAKLDQIEAGLRDSDQLGKGYAPTPTPTPTPTKRRFSFSRKKNAVAGVIATITVVGGIVGVLQAPNLAINHLREMLLGRASELQSNHSLRYRRKHLSRVSDMFSRDGRRGGKIIADMERSGYKFQFADSNDRKKITGIELPGGRSSLPNYAIEDHMRDYLEVRHPLRTSRWKTKRMDAFYNRYKVSRKSVVVRADGDTDGPDRTVNKRIAGQVVGDDVQMDVKAEQPKNGETAEEARQREQRNAQNGSVAQNDASLEDIKQKLKAGVPVEELSADEQTLLRATSSIDPELQDLMNRIGEGEGSVAGRTFNGLKGIFGSADIADKICIVKNRLRGVVIAARHHRALSMLRYTSVFVGASDETRAGRPDPKLINALMKRTTALDKNGNSLGASPGFAYIMKGKFSKSKNEAHKGSFGVDGKLTGVPGGIQAATDKVPGMSKAQCGVYQNPVTQIGLAAVEIAVGVFSGGTSSAAVAGSRQAVKQAASEALKSVISKQTAKGLAKGLAIDLSFEGVLALTQIYAEKSLTMNFTGQEKGGELGDIIAGGAGVMNKQRSLQAGMVPATAEQYSLAHSSYLADRSVDKQKGSLYSRFIDYSNHESLIFKVATFAATAPLSAEGFAAGMNGLVRSLISAPSTLFSSMVSPFMNRVSAQSSDEIPYDTYTTKGFNAGRGGASLATDPAGNLLPIMRADIEAIDPIANIAELAASEDIDGKTLEPKSDRFKNHIKNCVEAVDIISNIEKDDQSKPENDCLASQSITVKFKAHLAYIDLLDGIDGTLFPEDL